LFFIFSLLLYPYSALRMEAASYCDTSALTCQSTRCHKGEAEIWIFKAVKALIPIRYYKCTEEHCLQHISLWYWRIITAGMYSCNYTNGVHKN